MDLTQLSSIPSKKLAHPEIAEFHLFHQDEYFIPRWQMMKARLQNRYPDLDILDEVANCHAWKVQNGHVVKSVARTLANWCKRSNERRKWKKMDGSANSEVVKADENSREIDEDVAAEFQRLVRNKRPRL